MALFFAPRPEHPARSMGGKILLGLGMVGLGVGTEALRRRLMRSRRARKGSGLARRVGSEVNPGVAPKGRARPRKGASPVRRAFGRRRRPFSGE